MLDFLRVVRKNRIPAERATERAAEHTTKKMSSEKCV